MYILDVIPLIKIPVPLPQIVTYFTKESVKPGALVKVPFARRKILAVVENVSTLEERRFEIRKTSDFSLKKISDVVSPNETLANWQFKFGNWLAEKYLVSLGSVFKSFLPEFSSRNKTIFEEAYQPQLPQGSAGEQAVEKPVFLWLEKRLGFYRSEIDKTIKINGQVLFLTAETRQSEEIENYLKNIKELKSVSVSGNLKKSEELALWKEIRSGKANFIIGTRSAIFSPFKNLKLIIVDQEENDAFDVWGQDPRYDVRETAFQLAAIWQARLIFGADLPSLTSYWRIKNGEYDLIQGDEEKSPAKSHFIDLKKSPKALQSPHLSQEFIEKIKADLNCGSKAIIFTNRKGLSASILCLDCGFTFKCRNCDVPMAVSASGRNNFLFCRHCGRKENMPEICPNCQGRQIKPLGIGSQKIYEEMEKFFPECKIARLDSDSAPTDNEQKTLISGFLSQKIQILVATKLVLKFSLELKKVGQKIVAGVVLIDPVLNFPEFRSREKTFRLLYNLQKISRKIFIQTYNPELSLFQYLQQNRITDFFEDELKERRDFLYPPFVEIIDLGFSYGKSDKAESEAKLMKNKLCGALLHTGGVSILGPVASFVPKEKGQYSWHIIIKVKDQGAKAKNALLKVISPQWKIKVNPETLL